MRFVVGFVLALLVALPLAGCSKKPGTMQVSADVAGRDVEVRLALTNFQLPRDGHVHVFLDDNPDPVMMNRTTYTFHNLRPGEHVIRIQLTDPDHNPLTWSGSDQRVTVRVI